MAEQILRRLLCDIHLTEKDEEVEGQTYVAAIGSSGPQKVELCTECATVLDAVTQLLADYGRPADPSLVKKRRVTAEREDKRVACPVSGCGHHGASRDSMRSHLREAHETSWEEEEHDGPLPNACSRCARSFVRLQSLRVHRRLKHGLGADDQPLPAGAS